MQLKRSQSTHLRMNLHKNNSSLSKSQVRQFSLSNIKTRTAKNSQPLISPMNMLKQKILSYIEKRSDIEIINFYQQYKEQFYRKSINLQNLFYQEPQLRQNYLNQDKNPHFYKGFQHTLLMMFRKGTIVPGQFKNMRQDSVEEIQKWVFSWVKRKKAYEQAIREENIARQEVEIVTREIQEWGRKSYTEKAMF